MTEKREIYRDAAAVAILSTIMGVLLHSAWVGIYADVTNIESSILNRVPGMSSGGIQIVALFALGLYSAWVVLFTLDVRKRIQGYFLVAGTVLILAVLASFDTFLPQMEARPRNGGALLAGLTVGLATELFETRFHDGKPDLLQIDTGRSTVRRVLVDREYASTSEKYASFPVASRGVFAIIMLVTVGANVALVLSRASVVVILVTVVVSGLFGWRLLSLISIDDPPPSVPNVEILGPTDAGKTVFLYGLYLTAKYSDSDINYVESSEKWLQLTNEIERKGGWPEGTEAKDYEEYWIDVRLDRGYWEVVRVELTDFPGGWLNDQDIFSVDKDSPTENIDSEPTIGDGGTTPTDDEEDASDWIDHPDDNQQAEAAGAPPTQTDDETVIPTDDATATTPDRTRREEEDEDPFSQRESAGDSKSPEDVEENLKKSDKIIAVIDTKAVYDVGLLENIDHIKGNEETDELADPAIAEINRVCDEAGVEEIITVATKADYLIPEFLNETDETAPPHEELGDFETFRNWINSVLDKPGLDLSDGIIYPVYFQTKEEDGELIPETENGIKQPEGFEAVVEEIAPE